MQPEIFISPHPDDIGYSAYAAVSQRRRRRLMLTIFTRSFWNFRSIPFCRVAHITRLRAAEECAFAASYRLQVRMFGLPDGRLRGYDDQTEYQTLPLSDPIFSAVIEQLHPLLKNETASGARIFVPLGISNHIDHLICRDAVLAIAPLANIVFYEDLPYIALRTEQQIETYVRALDPRLEPRLVTSPGFAGRKRRAIESYATQLEPHTVGRILGYAQRIGSEKRPCERYWQL